MCDVNSPLPVALVVKIACGRVYRFLPARWKETSAVYSFVAHLDSEDSDLIQAYVTHNAGYDNACYRFSYTNRHSTCVMAGTKAVRESKV